MGNKKYITTPEERKRDIEAVEKATVLYPITPNQIVSIIGASAEASTYGIGAEGIIRKDIKEKKQFHETNGSTRSSDYDWGTLNYYSCRVLELEKARNDQSSKSDYYQTELEKAHTLLGRILHQLSERWDTVRVTKFFPTNNLWNRRSVDNPTGEKDGSN